MDRKNHLKGDDVKDPEKAMKRDKEKKRAAALNAFKVSRAEFTVWYVDSIGGAVEWAHPAVGWLFAAWVAGEGERDWHTEEEKVAIAKREDANRRRAEAQAKRKKEKEEESAKLAAARKKVSKVAKKAVKKVPKKK
jgi:hypothetical protein